MIEKNTFTMDPQTERDRVCPECNLLFSTDHLLRKFCSVQCHDRYHNRIKRDRKLWEEKRKQEQKNAVLSNNIKILDSLKLKERSEVLLNELSQIGFDFKVYDSRRPSGIEGSSAYAVTCASYILYWNSSNYLLIDKAKWQT